MTTATHDHSFTLPNVLKVETGTVFIPTEAAFSTLKTTEAYYKAITELLSMLSQEEKDKAEYEGDDDATPSRCFNITTENEDALIFAYRNDLLNEFDTAVDTVFNLPEVVSEAVCGDCVDELIETAYLDYSLKLLDGGLYLVNKEVG